MIEQIAGRFKIVADTSGSPAWVNIYTKGSYDAWDHLRQVEVKEFLGSTHGPLGERESSARNPDPSSRKRP